MPNFSATSKKRLETCHPDLQTVVNEAIKHFDCTVLEGHRGQVAQDTAFSTGKSKVKWPDGKHNTMPSLAIDIAPYPIDFNDLARIRYFAGFLMGLAAARGIKLRWGGDWDQDTEVKDNTFNDLVHFELVDAE